MDKKYSLIKEGKKVVDLDNLETAREGLEYFGSTTYIRYNQPGINNYEDAKRQESNNGNH